MKSSRAAMRYAKALILESVEKDSLEEMNSDMHIILNTVEENQNLRSLVESRVVKNSLAKIAIKDTSFECMNSSLKGPLIFAFSKEDLGSAAKVVNDFTKDNKLLKPVVVAVNGELVDVAKLSQIAALPNKDQAISMMMAVMKLPIEKFVRTLSAPNVKLVQTLSAYKIKLEQS